MPERDRLALRRSTVAFIFQSFGLIPMLSAAENVGVPLRITGAPPRAREERVATMLSIVGLSEHAAHRPDELSGGQQQRIAIARALAGPELLIADEPTSQLDLETGRQIMRLLLTVVRSEGITALVATHDEALIDLADSVLRLEDGRVQSRRPRQPGRWPRHRAATPAVTRTAAGSSRAYTGLKESGSPTRIGCHWNGPSGVAASHVPTSSTTTA